MTYSSLHDKETRNDTLTRGDNIRSEVSKYSFVVNSVVP